MKLTEQRINKLYERLKVLAANAFSHKKYDKALRFWELAAFTAYNYYLPLQDDDIELGLTAISNTISKRKDVFNGIKNKCVFYDAHGIARGGLTQQYIRAIMASGWDMVYITDVPKTKESFISILEELEQSERVEIVFVPQSVKGKNKIQFIYDSIMDAKAERLFMHIRPMSVCAVAAFDALPKAIEIYQINFTDHAYWVGLNCLDYILEFRKYGCNLSIAKRGIPESKVFLMPFYPIETYLPFEGYPFDRKGKIVVLSGGAYYKVIDESDTYFKLCKTVLSMNHNVVIVYAGYGDDSYMLKKISEYGLSERFYLLGFRKDISSLFDNCDVYLDTTPHSGGLMCQYAARHSVPILSFNEWEIEDFICQVNWMSIRSSTLKEFEQKAADLVKDENYRIDMGESLNRCCVSVKMFNDAFKKTVEDKQTQFSFTVDSSFQEIDSDREAKIKYENETKTYQRAFVRRLGLLPSLFEVPSFVLDSLVVLMRENRLFSVLKTRLYN